MSRPRKTRDTELSPASMCETGTWLDSVTGSLRTAPMHCGRSCKQSHSLTNVFSAHVTALQIRRGKRITLTTLLWISAESDVGRCSWAQPQWGLAVSTNSLLSVALDLRPNEWILGPSLSYGIPQGPTSIHPELRSHRGQGSQAPVELSYWLPSSGLTPGRSGSCAQWRPYKGPFTIWLGFSRVPDWLKRPAGGLVAAAKSPMGVNSWITVNVNNDHHF